MVELIFQKCFDFSYSLIPATSYLMFYDQHDDPVKPDCYRNSGTSVPMPSHTVHHFYKIFTAAKPNIDSMALFKFYTVQEPHSHRSAGCLKQKVKAFFLKNLTDKFLFPRGDTYQPNSWTLINKIR